MSLLNRLSFLRKVPIAKGGPARRGSEDTPPEKSIWPFTDLAVVTRALEKSPILLRQKRYDEAEHLLQEAARHSPRDCKVLVSLAHVAHGLNNWPEAEHRWQAVIVLYPELHYAHGYHATAILMQGRRHEAVRLYSDLIERFPEDLGPPSQLAYMLETMSASERELCIKIVDDSLAHFRAGNPGSVLALTAHARVAKVQGDWHIVRDRLRLALQLASNDTTIMDELAEAQLRCAQQPNLH